jgi:hypothetical protein
MPSPLDQVLTDIHAPTAAAPPQPSDVAPTNLGRAREAASLVTSGLSDKIIAAAQGAKSWAEGQGFGSGYQQSLQQGDPYAEAFRQQHPVLTPLIGAAGMAAAAPALPEAAATLPGRIAQGATLGAGTGAAAGYGQSTDAPGRDIATGAALGAVGGAALPVVAAAGAPLLRGFQNKLPWAFPNAVQDQATTAIAGRIAQDQAAGGPGVSDMLGVLQSVPNKPMSLTDVGGENLQALAGNVARQPGPARQMMRSLFTDRDVGAGDRLIQDIDGSIANGGSAYDAIQRQLTQRSADARPLYEEAFDRSGPAIQLPNTLAPFLKEPILQQGLATGLKIQRLEALAEGRPFLPNDYTVKPSSSPSLFTGTVDATGTPIAANELQFSETPNLRTLDAAKRGLDAMLSDNTYRDANTGRLTQMGRAIDQVRRSYVGQLDNLTGGPTGAYAQARAAWAGPSRAMEMIRNGQSFLSMSPDEVNATVSNLAPADRDFFQVGVADRLRQNVVDTALNADESKRLINSAGVKQRLRPMFASDDAFNGFVNNVMAERTMKETGPRIMGGSQTAGRIAEDAGNTGVSSAIGHVAAGVGALAAHEPFAAMPMIYRGVRGIADWMQQPNPAVNTEIARRLSRTTLPENEAILRGIAPPARTRTLPALTQGIVGAGANLYPAINGSGSSP